MENSCGKTKIGPCKITRFICNGCQYFSSERGYDGAGDYEYIFACKKKKMLILNTWNENEVEVNCPEWCPILRKNDLIKK